MRFSDNLSSQWRVNELNRKGNIVIKSIIGVTCTCLVVVSFSVMGAVKGDVKGGETIDVLLFDASTTDNRTMAVWIVSAIPAPPLFGCLVLA